MKLWTKLGLAALTLGVVVAMVLAGPAAPTRAAEGPTCEDVYAFCSGYADDVCGGDQGCYDACIVFGGFGEAGLNCGACAALDSACDFDCEGDSECIAVCKADLADEGLVCNTACTGGGGYTADQCAANIYGADDGGEGFCCSTCAGIPGCD